MRILIVDDDEDILASQAALLRMRGHTVRTASHVPDALAMLEASRPFDVVITDLQLNSLSGRDLICAMRNSRCHPGWYETPIIIATGTYPRDEWADLEELPNVYGLVRPFKQEQLDNILEEIDSPTPV